MAYSQKILTINPESSFLLVCACLLFPNFISKKALKAINNVDIMLKDLAVEIAVLICLVFCIFLIVPMLMYPYQIDVESAPLPFIGFIVFLIVAIFHVNKLLNGGKTKHAIAFAGILITATVISSIITWILFQPKLL